jgi:1,4-alpha-glucan branching enzyme
LRVLFAAREYPPYEVGGVAVHTFNLVKHLRALGVDCSVVAFGKESSSEPGVKFIDPDSSIISRKDEPLAKDARIPFDIVRYTALVGKVIEGGNYDIVHVEEPYVGAMLRHPRKVTTVHDTSFGELKSISEQGVSAPAVKRGVFYVGFGFFLEGMSMKSSKAVIAPFPHIKEELVKVYGVPPEKVRVIRNGVDLPPTGRLNKTEAKRGLGLADKPLIFTAAQHVARKRLDTLVEGARILRGEGVDAQVVIAGEGPLRGKLVDLVRKYKLEGTISLPGWVSRKDLEAYYQAADIFTLTSDYEAGPISLLEAMSYGDAVVCSQIQGFASFLREGIDAFLFPVGDSRALSICIRRALEDGEFLKNAAANGRSFAERFDWDSVAKETLSLYEELM